MDFQPFHLHIYRYCTPPYAFCSHPLQVPTTNLFVAQMRALTAGGESAAPTTPDMQSPPSHDDGIDTSRHRSTSAPPPKYTRDSAEDDPFRDGDTPVGFYYHEKRGIDERLSAATPNRMDSPQPTSYPIREPTVVNADLDEEPLPLPARPVPSRGPGPMRGLQVPSRTSIITWGFKLPPILVEQGVTKAHWKMFTTELKSFAAMSKTQWSTVFVAGAVVSAFVAVPLPFIGHFITPSEQGSP